VGAVGGRIFSFPIDLAHRLYNSLLLPHKPWYITLVELGIVVNALVMTDSCSMQGMFVLGSWMANSLWTGGPPLYSQPPDQLSLTIVVRLMPPLSLRRNVIFGGVLFSRRPNPSSSCSKSFLCCSGLRTSRTMNIRLQVRATVNTQNHTPMFTMHVTSLPEKPSWYVISHPCQLSWPSLYRWAQWVPVAMAIYPWTCSVNRCLAEL